MTQRPGSRAGLVKRLRLGLLPGWLLAIQFCALLWAGPALAADLLVPAEPGALQRQLAAAGPGDSLVLAAGDHQGPVVIERPVTLRGEPGARVLGDGSGHVIVVDAPGAVVRGLGVTGSGLSLASEDSGIFVTKRALGARIEANRLDDNLIGIYLKGARDAQVIGNEITGRQDLRMNERGNGIHIWNAPGARVEDNRVRFGRDGIFVTTSKNNAFIGNRLSDLRFAVHYMYTNASILSGNISRGNHVGFALMYSNRLAVSGNRSEGDRDHGFLLNYANNARFEDNAVTGGSEKCLFIYNANKNQLRRNRFEGCGIGIHFTAGSERNVIAGNAFIGNRNQVKYVGTRDLEWSREGRGNFWSDNLAYDLDGDGLGDQPYRPNDLVDQIVWRHPLAKLLLNSPAAQVLRWAQSAFPALYPGGVRDSHPLMTAERGAGTAEGG